MGFWRTAYWLAGVHYPKDLIWLEQTRWDKYKMLEELQLKVSRDGSTKPSDVKKDDRDEEGFKEVKPKIINTKKPNLNNKYIKINGRHVMRG